MHKNDGVITFILRRSRALVNFADIKIVTMFIKNF